MTDEERGMVNSKLYAVMDDLTNLVRSIGGSAGYVKMETPECVTRLMDIEGVIHRVIHTMQRIRSEEDRDGS